MTYVTHSEQALFSSFVDEQTVAQAELDAHIEAQAQTVAPEELIPVEISFYDHEIYCGQKLVAAIAYDYEDVTQPWLVMANGQEIYRANTWARAWRYICTHHKDGSLPIHQQQETPAATDNEIMCQIFNECEKFGFELLDNGIYHNDVKLGEVGYTNNQWWFVRASEEDQGKIPCDSALDGVWWLSMVETISCEELLNRPFDQLTDKEWRMLLEYEPMPKSRELVVA
ncbi:hypothetical protein [Nodularia spumigena]|uniref:hypothetical protein n=1 Tax=Nodularia spumigena TaxID=70799 RepID=UPI002B210690|nr:hypothetical protein [Nodularia spumigena]MEA5557176.1 hypothetical protein [Nodularia spumigena CH309]